MGVTEERTSMSDESKNKVGLPDIKVMGLFLETVAPWTYFEWFIQTV